MDPASKTTTPAIRACYRTDLGAAPDCDETTAITSVVIESSGILPGYMTRSTDVMTVAPTANSQSATYVMLVTHSTTFEDDPITFNTLTLIVNDCVITHIDPPNSWVKNSATETPADFEYIIHSLTDISIDLSSPGYVQQPACGYTLTEVMAWSFNPSPANPITTSSSSPYTMTISSATNSDAEVYVATLTNSVSYQGQSFMPSISFTVTVTDPCLTTVITPFDINVGNTLTQEAGEIIETLFNEPADSAGTAVGDQSICGPKTYTVTY